MYTFHICRLIMRFLENFVAAATVVTFVNGTTPVTGHQYCKALTQDRASRCENGLCTFNNGLNPKYSCSYDRIEYDTRIYQNNVVDILRKANDLDHVFRKQYSDFLRYTINVNNAPRLPGYLLRNQLMEILAPILNIVLFIPNGLLRDSILMEYREDPKLLSQIKDEVVRYRFSAYGCIAVLGMIDVPDRLIRHTLEENLSVELTELYKYTTLSHHTVLSIEESLHLFELIKRFHQQGLTTNPRFHYMTRAIMWSLFTRQACRKPEFAIAQNYHTMPVDFSKWGNVVEAIKRRYPQVTDWHDSLPEAAQIIDIFTDKVHVDNPMLMDILTGLINGAGITMPPPADHVATGIAFSRFDLLRASFEKLYKLHCPPHTQYDKLTLLFRLIIANHFENIPNDPDHPIVFRKLPIRASFLEELYDFLSPDPADYSSRSGCQKC